MDLSLVDGPTAQAGGLIVNVCSVNDLSLNEASNSEKMPVQENLSTEKKNVCGKILVSASNNEIKLCDDAKIKSKLKY